MTLYKITLNTNQALIADDPRTLEDITSSLCKDGFLLVKKRAAYKAEWTQFSILAVAVLSIEPHA